MIARMLRRLALFGLAIVACFSESNESTSGNGTGDASESTAGSTAANTTASADATSVAETQAASESTGSGACEGGMVRVPGPPPVGWEGWSFVAEGMPMQPPVPCEQGEPDVRFAAAAPICRCECTGDIACAPHVETFGNATCQGIAMGTNGIGGGCTGLLASVSSLRIGDGSTSDNSCRATGSLLPGFDATPISLCAAPDEGCVDVPAGFVGPCVVGLGETCPAGFDELFEVDSVSCSVCPPCTEAEVCAARRYDAFDTADCSGAAVATIAADDSCAPGAFQSVQPAAPDPMAPSGCADATLQLAHQRICCAPAP